MFYQIAVLEVAANKHEREIASLTARIGTLEAELEAREARQSEFESTMVNLISTLQAEIEEQLLPPEN